MTSPSPAACLIGWPARHSRSPKLHGYWLERYRIDGRYGFEEVPPDAFAEFVTHLREHGYVGANVTMPHKEMAFALSEPDARATAVGAANTLWFEDGRLKSTNTDIEGFLGSLDAAAKGWDERTRHAVVLGAGGASRAVIYGLIERGIDRITVVNRSHDKAIAVADAFGPSVAGARWADLSDHLAGADLLVNSTSLGMKGEAPLVIEIAGLAPTAVVSDIVYVPLTTPLLAAARARGHATANGLDMLLHQAVRGFELWFGVRPEVTQDQFDLLAADIEPA